MKLTNQIDILAGGEGSGCKGSNCGRPKTRDTVSTDSSSYEASLSPELKKYAKEFRDEVKRQGYDPSKVIISNSNEATSGGAIAAANNKTGELFFNPELKATDDYKKLSMKSIIAHELMHLKFTKYFKDHRDEISKIDPESLIEEDGLTKYSEQIWDAYKYGPFGSELAGLKPASFMLGVHETLAEMARMEADGKDLSHLDIEDIGKRHPAYNTYGEFDETGVWKTLYNKVNEYNRLNKSWN